MSDFPHPRGDFHEIDATQYPDVRLGHARHPDGHRRGQGCSCRCSPYRDVPRIHRRHIDKGQAVLKTKEGERLDCEWVSHLPDVQGTCRAQDGRVFKLVEAKPAK